jgi:hypothetical protein
MTKLMRSPNRPPQRNPPHPHQLPFPGSAAESGSNTPLTGRLGSTETPKPKTYAMPLHRRLDAAYTTLPRKLSSAILGLCTGHGYFLDCLAQPPTDTYLSRNCTCPLHPPQTPKHLLLSCPEHRTTWETLRQDLKLGRLTRPHLSTTLHTTAGSKALATFISASKVATAEWAHSRLSNRPMERDPPLSLTTGRGTLLDDAKEHADHDAQRAESG